MHKRVPPGVPICLLGFLVNNHEFDSLKILNSKNLEDRFVHGSFEKKSAYLKNMVLFEFVKTQEYHEENVNVQKTMKT